MAKDKNLLPDAPELPEETGDVIDPEEQKQLDAFYREHPEAMRKWVDTDDSAFGAFPDPKTEPDEDEIDSDLEDGEDSDVDTTKNAFCPTGVGGGVDPSCGSKKVGGIAYGKIEEGGHFVRVESHKTKEGYQYAGPFKRKSDAVLFNALVNPDKPVSDLGVDFVSRSDMPMVLADSRDMYTKPSKKHIKWVGEMPGEGFKAEIRLKYSN